MEHRGLGGRETIQYDTIIADTRHDVYLSEPIEL